MLWKGEMTKHTLRVNINRQYTDNNHQHFGMLHNVKCVNIGYTTAHVDLAKVMAAIP